MEDLYRPPNILRIRGVRLADYVPVEDLADARLLEPGTDGGFLGPDDPAPEALYPYDKIPRVFTGLADWPLSTNLACWVCDRTFDDRPKFVPTYAREGEDGGIEMGVRGNMCTFNCAEQWIEDYLAGEACWRAQENLCLAYFLFTGRRAAHIKAAPRKTERARYGGDWDEDTYSQRLRALDPVAGLRDHTPGSVVPERDRPRRALAAIRAGADRGRAPAPAASRGLAADARSVWGVCGAAMPGRAGPGPACDTGGAEPAASRPPTGASAAAANGALGSRMSLSGRSGTFVPNGPASAGPQGGPAPAGLPLDSAALELVGDLLSELGLL
jgi:hypothetical protein